jgi:hypothetical protein
MGDEIQAGRNRRLGLILGVGIGVGIVAAKGAEKMLTPSLGEWGAFGVGLLVAVAVAPAAGLLVARVLGGRVGTPRMNAGLDGCGGTSLSLRRACDCAIKRRGRAALCTGAW